jgi:ABC-type sugar transport system substrate-binding protein
MKLHRSALSLLALVVLLLGACASGSAIVTGNTRVPIAPEQVKIYLDPPAEFEVIGLVNASSDAGWTDQGSQDYAIEELKKQAAKLGANGVLLVSSGEKTTTAVGGYGTGYFYAIPVTAKTVQGRAIFVKGQ